MEVRCRSQHMLASHQGDANMSRKLETHAQPKHAYAHSWTQCLAVIQKRRASLSLLHAHLSTALSNFLPKLDELRQDCFNLGICLTDVYNTERGSTGHDSHCIYCTWTHTSTSLLLSVTDTSRHVRSKSPLVCRSQRDITSFGMRLVTAN